MKGFRDSRRPAARRSSLRGLALLTCAILLLWPAGHSGAGQDDPRLPDLFERLARASSDMEARPLEGKIWEIWNQSGSADIDRLLLRGTQAMNAGELDSAIRTFTQVIERAPGFAEGWNKRATAYYQQGSYDASIKDVEETLKLEPRHFAALSGLGLIYTELGADAPALHWFQKALTVHPNLAGVRSRVLFLQRKLRRSVI